MASPEGRFSRTLVFLCVDIICQMVVCSAIPSIVTSPSSLELMPGDTATLQCVVEGKTNEYLVAWIKNGVRITRSNNESLDANHVDPTRYSLEGPWSNGDYTLTIRNVRTFDAGEFYCAIDSAEGFRIATSDVAIISVEYAPEEDSFNCLPTDVTDLRIDYAVTFVCLSDVGNPPAELSWSPSVNVSRITDGGRTRLEFTKIIEVADNGKSFRCDLNHKLLPGPRSCVVGPLGVIYMPSEVVITTDLSNALVLQRNGATEAILDFGTRNVLFNCDAQGNPDPDFIWTVTEASGCSSAQNHFANSMVLVLTTVTMAYDGATIKCTANNTVGTISASVTIRVRNSPPNALCYSTTHKPTTIPVPSQKPTKAPVANPAPSLTTLHIIIIVIAVAFLIIIVILGYIALTRRREPIVVIGGGDDTRSIAESYIFHSRHNTPDPEHRSNSLGRMQSNFSTMSYDTQSIDSATALMHLKSLESPEYKANPKLTGSPVRKAKCEPKCEAKCEAKCETKCGKDAQCDEKDDSPFSRRNIAENTYEGSPRRTPVTSTPKSSLTRQPSEHKYEECPPLKRYVTHASQTDLTIIETMIDEKEEAGDSTSDSDDDFDYNPPKQNFSVNNCNIRYAKHTEV